jgi:hypothetical protein
MQRVSFRSHSEALRNARCCNALLFAIYKIPRSFGPSVFKVVATVLNKSAMSRSPIADWSTTSCSFTADLAMQLDHMKDILLTSMSFHRYGCILIMDRSIDIIMGVHFHEITGVSS